MHCEAELGGPQGWDRRVLDSPIVYCDTDTIEFFDCMYNEFSLLRCIPSLRKSKRHRIVDSCDDSGGTSGGGSAPYLIRKTSRDLYSMADSDSGIIIGSLSAD